MRYEILDGTTVINTILAGSEYMAEHYPLGTYREVAESAPVQPKAQLTRLQFFNRFTDTELVTIYTAAKTVIQIEIMLDKFKSAEFIDTSDPQTIGGINSLEAAGIIVQHRAAEILA
ncbi:MAG: hypothetical protein WCP20_10915 [Desulfuromonadales bacterium]